VSAKNVNASIKCESHQESFFCILIRLYKIKGFFLHIVSELRQHLCVRVCVVCLKDGRLAGLLLSSSIRKRANRWTSGIRSTMREGRETREETAQIEHAASWPRPPRQRLRLRSAGGGRPRRRPGRAVSATSYVTRHTVLISIDRAVIPLGACTNHRILWQADGTVKSIWSSSVNGPWLVWRDGARTDRRYSDVIVR